jgi:hypothetical protein
MADNTLTPPMSDRPSKDHPIIYSAPMEDL